MLSRPEPGVLVVRGNQVAMGLCVGSSDLIGWRAVSITPDMVGQTIAQFVALEVKTPSGPVSPEQQRFIDSLNSCGGLGAVVRSKYEAAEVVDPRGIEPRSAD